MHEIPSLVSKVKSKLNSEAHFSSKIMSLSWLVKSRALSVLLGELVGYSKLIDGQASLLLLCM